MSSDAAKNPFSQPRASISPCNDKVHIVLLSELKQDVSLALATYARNLSTNRYLVPSEILCDVCNLRVRPLSVTRVYDRNRDILSLL